jgi:hypothetical protein
MDNGVNICKIPAIVLDLIPDLVFRAFLFLTNQNEQVKREWIGINS